VDEPNAPAARARRIKSTKRHAKNTQPSSAAHCAVVNPNATAGTSRAKSTANRNAHISIPCT
jgi:hypothetical protein